MAPKTGANKQLQMLHIKRVFIPFKKLHPPLCPQQHFHVDTDTF